MAKLDRENILAALRTVMDPDLHRDLVSLNATAVVDELTAQADPNADVLSVAVDPKAGTVTVSVEKHANTLLVKRVGFLKRYVTQEATDSEVRSA